MPYDFFLSYTRDDNDSFLQLFFKDLSDSVRKRSGVRAPRRVGRALEETAEVGFFAQKTMKLGAEWNPELMKALQSSRALVCIYSPSYFNSEASGREWKFFDLRRDLYVEAERAGGDANVIAPPVILPVLWIPLRRELPEGVRGVDFDLDDPDGPHNTIGLLTMTKLKNSKYASEYTEFVDKLADAILDAGDYNLQPLDLRGFPTFESVPNAFDDSPPPPGVGEDGGEDAQTPPPGTVMITESKPLGPNNVQFVFVAGSPAEFIAANLGYRKEEEYDAAYFKNGGGDWRPYDPEQRIRPYVTHIATAGGLSFDVDVLEFDEHLDGRVGEAKERRNLVIILVDSWTLDLEKYEKGLRTLRALKNCSILIPWNEKDPALTPAQRARLERKIRETFDNWWGVVTPLRFCYTIHSPDDLDNKVRETLRALRDSFINDVMADDMQEIQRAVESTITKPGLSNAPTAVGTK